MKYLKLLISTLVHVHLRLLSRKLNHTYSMNVSIIKIANVGFLKDLSIFGLIYHIKLVNKNNYK